MEPSSPDPQRPKPVVLAILDGFGVGHGDEHDAIFHAKTPCLDDLLARFPQGKINASELHVGLPEGQMGNSEVGHMNIGAGRVVMQDLPRIDEAIASGTIESAPAFGAFINRARQGTGVCHLMGLMSPGGVHAHQDHMVAMAKLLAKSGLQVKIHAFLDGRDTPPKSALDYVTAVIQALQGAAQIVTLSGRFYAMDRDKRWDRVEQAYESIVSAKGETYSDALHYIQSQYHAGITDEFITPAHHAEYQGMEHGDALFMANFRADRAREILHALTDSPFEGFQRSTHISFAAMLGMVEYSSALASVVHPLFPPESLQGLLGEVAADAGLKQLRIAETEKYAHVTFFLNGGREEVYPGEERILVPSPKVKTYDLKPEMSAYEVTDKLVDAIEQERFDLVVVNYANADMVGHTGDMQASIKAVEAVDACIKRVSDAVLAKNGVMLITADHGNIEQLHDHATGQAHTAHTLNVVPAILVSAKLAGKTMDQSPGKLADIAPTILEWLQLPAPKEMSGRSLLQKVHA